MISELEPLPHEQNLLVRVSDPGEEVGLCGSPIAKPCSMPWTPVVVVPTGGSRHHTRWDPDKDAARTAIGATGAVSMA